MTVSAPASFMLWMFWRSICSKTSHLPATSMGVPQQFSFSPRWENSTPAASMRRTVASPMSFSTWEEVQPAK